MINRRTQALQQSYDAVAEEYANRISDELTHKPLDRALLDYFAGQVNGGGIVADVGCGPGHVTRYLHQRGLQMVGIDLSPGMIEVAQRRNGDIPFRHGSMLALDQPDASWAGIVCFYAIIHLLPDDVSRACREFYRVLAPGGMLLLAFHWGEKHVHLEDWWGHTVDLHTHFYTREMVEGLLDAAGFSIEARLERRPDVAIEYPSERVYLIARKAMENDISALHADAHLDGKSE